MMERLIRANHWLTALVGWRRYGVSVFFGVLAALALPPVYAVIFLVPAFVGLIWLVDSSSGLRGAFAVGWWFGFGHFVAGLYWIGIALSVKADQFGWLIPFAVFGLPAVIACYTAVIAMLAKAMQLRGLSAGAGRIVLFAVIWVFFEWVRGWAFTGFPWNLIGTVWTFSDLMIQVAAITGVYGLSFVTVLGAAMPAILTDECATKHSAYRTVIIALAILVGVGVGGAVRLSQAETKNFADVRLRLVQPNIPQRLKWQRDKRTGHVMKQLHLSRATSPSGKAKPSATSLATPTHIIWAETAVPYYLAREPNLRRVLAEGVPKNGLIITGAPRIEKKGPQSSNGHQAYQAWNSLHAIDASGGVVATYDKSHLVPFGEYVPFRWLLNMSKITTGTTDFTPGPGPQTLTLKGLPPVSPLICYEGIFPGHVIASGPRPKWLLNVTNDAWYGRSAGPFQHFASVRLRAVEEGMPLVRVANTGISAVVDSYGRTIASLGLSREGVIDSPLPHSLSTLTPYARYGNRIILVILFFMMVGGLFLSRRAP